MDKIVYKDLGDDLMTEIEKKRAYLENYWNIEEELNNIDLEARQIVSDVRGIKGMEYSDMPRGHKKTDLSDKMVMLELRLDELRKGKRKLLEEKYRIIKAINSLQDAKQKRILYEKYVNKKRNEEIGDLLGYGGERIKKVVRKALEEITI